MDRRHGKLRLGSAHARGQRADRFGGGGQQPFRAEGDAARRKLGKPRDMDAYSGPFGYARWSQDVYFKLVDCGLRHSAHRRQRLGHVAQPGRLQPRLRASRRQLRLPAMVEEPEGGAGRRHQRPVAAAQRRERTARPYLPRRRRPGVGTANRPDADHSRANQLPGDRSGRAGAEFDPFRRTTSRMAACRRCISSRAAGSCCGWWARFPTPIASP